MKKLFSVLIAGACLLSVILCAGCTGLNINNRADTAYLFPADAGDCYVYYIGSVINGYGYLNVDKASGGVALETGEEREYAGDKYPAVAFGNDFPRYSDNCAEGYANLPSALSEKYEGDDIRHIQYYAVEYDRGSGSAYGFCNLYYSAAGFLSGGGNISADKLAAGVFFKYDKESGEVAEICRLEKCNIVAFNKGKLVYFKDEKYFSYDVATAAEKFICDDAAYDKGVTNYSYAKFFFDENICVIVMNTRFSNDANDFDTIVACTYGGEILLSEKLKK